jgi:hypothetical protein
MAIPTEGPLLLNFGPALLLSARRTSRQGLGLGLGLGLTSATHICCVKKRKTRPPSPAEPPPPPSRSPLCQVLLWKNFTLLRRKPANLLKEVLVPCMIVLVVGLLKGAADVEKVRMGWLVMVVVVVVTVLVVVW